MKRATRHLCLGAALVWPALAACSAPLPAQEEARRIAITIDDLPMAPPGRHTPAQQAVILRRARRQVGHPVGAMA